MRKIAIVDDSEIDRLILRRNLEQRYGDAVIISEFESYQQLNKQMEDGDHFVIMFLDIYTGEEENGIEWARQIRQVDKEVQIIFVSGSDEFLGEGYDVFAVGYLIKPYKREKLKHILDHLDLNWVDAPKGYLHKKGSKMQLLLFNEIEMVESNAHYVFFHMVDGEIIREHNKLDLIELDSRFLRCHKSFLVNMDYIVEVNDNFVLKDGTVANIRKRDSAEIKKMYYTYCIGKEGIV